MVRPRLPWNSFWGGAERSGTGEKRLTHRYIPRWLPPQPPECRTLQQHISPSRTPPVHLSPPPGGQDGSHEPLKRRQQAATLVCITHADDGEGVLLLVLQVLLNVEEGVKEDVGQLAPLQVPQRDLTCEGRGVVNTGELKQHCISRVKDHPHIMGVMRSCGEKR